MSTRILKIGRTNYYSVKKGQQQYCIAEGRRVQDLDHCWQVLRDPDSGRNFFVNRSGVRRWHLPDIYQTERERREEEKTLALRREQKKKSEEQKRLREAGGGGGGQPDDDDDDENKKKPEEEEVSEALKGVVNNKELFAARDAAARLLPLLPGWETPEKRKVVTRLAKAVLSPFFHQGAIDEEALAALVMTGTREFCTRYSTLDSAARETFTRDLKSLVQARVDEDTRRNEFQKLNEDLLERLKRLDQERKEQAAKIAEMTKAEEATRQELIKLKGDKQDELLKSFKRLTKAGLVQSYWERWTRYKAIVEAQNDVAARERRARENVEKIKELEYILNDREKEVEALREADQIRRSREVIERILGQLGRDVLQRFFVKWVKFAMEKRSERELWEMRKEMENCPRCAQRSVDMDRVSAHVLDAWQATHVLQRRLADKEEEADRHYTTSQYWRAMADFNGAVCSDARSIANMQFGLHTGREHLFRSQEQKIKELTREVDGLRFEVSAGGGGGGNMMAMSRDGDDDGGGDYGGGAAGGGGFLGGSPTKSSGGGGGNYATSSSRPRHGVRPADDQQLTSFFLKDASIAESKLERRLGTRGDAGLPPPSDGVVFGGPRGYVESNTQSSIAPNVFNAIKASIPNNSTQQSGSNGTLHQQHGGKYYDPVIVNTNGSASSNAGGGFESAFDQRTREIQQKKLLLETQGSIPPKDGYDAKTNRRGVKFLDIGGDMNKRRGGGDEDPPPPSSDDEDSSSSSSSDSSSSDSSSDDSSGHKSPSSRKNSKTRKQSKSSPASPARSGTTMDVKSPATAAKENKAPDPISRYLAEKEARKHQAAVLQFIKPPMTAEEMAAQRQKALAEAFETAEEKEAKRCHKCGFRYDSAAFCPKDGARHTFRPLELLKVPVEGVPHHNQQPTNAIGGTGPLPDAVAKLLAQQQQQQPMLTHRDDPMRALVLPEYQGAATRQLTSEQAPAYLKLPNGMVPANDDGTIPDLGPLPPPPHPLVQRHTSLLRSSLNLNPHSYQQPRIYTIGGEDNDSFVPAAVQHPKELADAQHALEQEALYRDTIDNVRFTRIMTESTRRITDRANVHSVAAEEKLRSYAEKSIIAGYNPTADPDSALSLESRLFTGKHQTKDLDKDNLNVPNYFTATRGFASKTGAFQSTNTVPTLVQEKLNTHASAYYKDLQPSRTVNGNGNGAAAGSGSALGSSVLPMSDSERVQRNIQHFNDASRHAALNTSSRAAMADGLDSVHVPINRGAGGFQHQSRDLQLTNARSGGGAAVLNANRALQQQQQQQSSSAQQQRTSWSNVFQYNDVLFDRGLGLNAGENTSQVFGTLRETQAQRPTNAQMLAAQMQSAPSFVRQ